jgi:hypothetical protein
MALSVTVHGFLTRIGTQSNGRFAAADITTTDGTDTILYTVPDGGGDIDYSILAVSICNRASVSVPQVSVAVASADAPELYEFIEWNTTIVPNGVLERTQILAAPGDRIIVRVGQPSSVVVRTYGNDPFFSDNPTADFTNNGPFSAHGISYSTGMLQIQQSQWTNLAGFNELLTVGVGDTMTLLASGDSDYIFTVSTNWVDVGGDLWTMTGTWDQGNPVGTFDRVVFNFTS